MTKYPLLFLTGKRSLFYFENYWNWIPEALYQHGYEVYEASLPWRNNKSKNVKNTLLALLNNHEKYHIIFDETLQEDLITLLKENNSLLSIASLTCVKTKTNDNHLSYKPTSLPIEDLLINKTKNSFLFMLHKFFYLNIDLHISSSALGDVSAKEQPELINYYLERIVFLAERDFTQGEPHHGSIQRATSSKSTNDQRSDLTLH